MSPTDLADFHRFFAYQASPSCDILPHNSPPAKKSVAIRCAGGASKPSGRQRSKSKRSVKRPIRAHREIRVFDKSSPHGHSTSHMPHSTFNIPHPTPNIAHPTFHIQHSTFSTSLPQIYTVFPVEHRLAFKYAILAHLCNHLTFNYLPPKEPIRYPTRPIPPHEKPCFAPPSLPFRGSISYLSRLDT